jgi:hypothetical protein
VLGERNEDGERETYVGSSLFLTEAGVGIGEVFDCVDVFCCLDMFGADCFSFAGSVEWFFYRGCHLSSYCSDGD